MNDTSALLAELLPLEPPEVSLVPAVGWWILLLAVLALITIVWFFIRRYHRQRWLREARNELEVLRRWPADQDDAREFLTAVSVLLRRVLIKSTSRAEIAPLHGEEWLSRLDALAGDTIFRNEFGPLLSEGPYRRSASITPEERQSLITASETVIKRSVKSHV